MDHPDAEREALSLGVEEAADLEEEAAVHTEIEPGTSPSNPSTPTRKGRPEDPFAFDPAKVEYDLKPDESESREL